MTARPKQAQVEQTLESVLQNQPPDWVNPAGTGQENGPADVLSWKIVVRGGLADKLTGLIATQKPMVERLRQLIRLTAAKGTDPLLLADYEKRLANIEPALKRNEALLSYCAAWVGCGPRHLEARVREAEAALVAVETERSDYVAARGIVVAAAPDPEVVERALASADKSIAAKVDAAQAAVKAARAARDANLEAISVAQAKLASLRK